MILQAVDRPVPERKAQEKPKKTQFFNDSVHLDGVSWSIQSCMPCIGAGIWSGILCKHTMLHHAEVLWDQAESNIRTRDMGSRQMLQRVRFAPLGAQLPCVALCCPVLPCCPACLSTLLWPGPVRPLSTLCSWLESAATSRPSRGMYPVEHAHPARLAAKRCSGSLVAYILDQLSFQSTATRGRRKPTPPVEVSCKELQPCGTIPSQVFRDLSSSACCLHVSSSVRAFCGTRHIHKFMSRARLVQVSAVDRAASPTRLCLDGAEKSGVADSLPTSVWGCEIFLPQVPWTFRQVAISQNATHPKHVRRMVWGAASCQR